VFKYHPVTEQIQEFLREHGIRFKTFEHAPVRTSAEAQALRPEYKLSQGAKALIIGHRSKAIDNSEKKFTMFVMPADRRLDGSKAKDILKTKKFSFATEEEVLQVTSGVQPGGVPPFGNLFNIPLYVDPTLFENEEIIFNAGDKSFSLSMKAEDYKKAVSSEVVSFT
jgi:Ala-tRNA(Pro) deacylase